MNRQPYCRPPQWWAPKLWQPFVRASRGYRKRQLTKHQRIISVEVQNAAAVQDAVSAGTGVLITPNHSVHYDAPALYLAADTIDQPLYFMTAWQVFAMSSRLERWAMQGLGCFSVDREGTDKQAFKQAVQLLQGQSCPLVIFPEGDIYHTTDCVTLFREGAAAIALSAAKRSARDIVAIPCGIKFWYVEDPTDDLEHATARLEQRLYLRTDRQQPLVDRIHRLAEAALALKELDYLGHTRSGRLRERVGFLQEHVLAELEHRHNLSGRGKTTPARVKMARQKVIDLLESDGPPSGRRVDAGVALAADMEDLFFVMQLYSYRGDYLADQPTIERLAETVDKFEEDILELDYPKVRGTRRAVIRFGQPLSVQRSGGRNETAKLTQHLQDRVQSLIDELNDQSPS